MSAHYSIEDSLHMLDLMLDMYLKKYGYYENK